MPAYQGVNYIRLFTLRKCSDNSPVDITNWEFLSHIRDSRDDETILMVLSTANGGWTVIDGVNGRLQMSIRPNMGLLPTGKMIFDVLRTDIVTGPYWIFEAVFLVKRPVTRIPVVV